MVEGNEIGVVPYKIRVSEDGELFAVDEVNSNIVKITPPLSQCMCSIFLNERSFFCSVNMRTINVYFSLFFYAVYLVNQIGTFYAKGLWNYLF